MTASNNDMQKSINQPTLLQMPQIVKSHEENTEREQLSNEDTIDFLRKPVRLSAFLKELKEAENEPIPDVKHIDEIDDNDEVDNKEDELLEELNDSINVQNEITSTGTLLQNYDEELSRSITDMLVDKEVLSLNKCDEKPPNLDEPLNLSTPASKVNVHNFLTPNMINLRTKPYINSFYTQYQNRNRCKAQNNKDSSLSSEFRAVQNLDKAISTKKSLFPLTKKKSNLTDISEAGCEMENKGCGDCENSNKDSQKILCSVLMEKPILDPFEKITVNKVEYMILNQIGRGGSSVIFHCYDPKDRCDKAIKRVSLTGDKACITGYINEVRMLHKLQSCDRIIKMYEYEIIQSEKVLLMVLEKGEKDLATILKELSNNINHLPMYMLIYYWMEMLYAVKQIHENGIIHSDLKPANFLMVSSKLKLIDFGIASSIQTDMTSVIKDIRVGSFNYISPEALINNSQDSQTANFKISYKTDVWSLGCILYQLVYNKTPFKHIGNTHAKLSAIIDPKHVIDCAEIDWVPPNILQVIKSCLQYDMKSRPSIEDLIKQFKNIYY